MVALTVIAIAARACVRVTLDLQEHSAPLMFALRLVVDPTVIALQSTWEGISPQAMGHASATLDTGARCALKMRASDRHAVGMALARHLALVSRASVRQDTAVPHARIHATLLGVVRTPGRTHALVRRAINACFVVREGGASTRPLERQCQMLARGVATRIGRY